MAGMRTWGRYAAGLAVAGSVLLAAPAAAQISDSQGGWDHVNEPPPGAFSSADWCLALSDLGLVGEEIAIEADGPSGPVSGTGIVGADGTVKVRVGITEGGPYTITSISVTSSGTAIDASGVDDIDVVFDPAFLDCFDGLMPAPVETTSTTTTTTTTTVVPSTAAPTSSAAPTPPPESEPADEGSGGGGLLIGLGVGSLLLGTAVFASQELPLYSTTKCERERKEVERLTARVKKLRAKAKIDREAGERYLRRAERRRAEGKTAAADRDVEQGQKDLRSADAAEAEANGAADQLLSAQRAYDACLGRNGGGTGTRGGGGGTTAPPGPTSPPPEESDDGSNRDATDCCQSGMWIGINVSGAAEMGVGREWGTLYLICQSNPSRMAIVTWSGLRAGVVAGVEGGTALFVLASGPEHPIGLEEAVKKVLGGWDFDISIGLSPIRLLKTGWKGLKAGKGILDAVSTYKDLSKAAAKAESVRKSVKKLGKLGQDGYADRLNQENLDALSELARSELADSLMETAAKSAASEGQSGAAGVMVPLVGLGLQAGIWKLMDVETDLLSYTGCDRCEP